MGIESKDHPSIERKDELLSPVEIQNITAFAGIDMEELKRRSVANLLAEIEKEDERTERHFRKKFDIPEDTPLEEGLRQRAEERAEKYQEHIEASIARFQEQTDHSITLAKAKGYVEKERSFSIVVTDPFLNFGSAEPVLRPMVRHYDISSDSIGINFDDKNILLAHEIGHALSADPKTGRSGFIRYRSMDRAQDFRTEGNSWLNEGATIIWEEMSTVDKSQIGWRENGDTYIWNHKATQLIIQETGIDQDTLLKAYFGNKEALSALESKIRECFNCSIDDLDCLEIEKDMGLTKRIISGQPVEIKMNAQRYEAIRDTVEKLQVVFPNVIIIIN